MDAAAGARAEALVQHGDERVGVAVERLAEPHEACEVGLTRLLALAELVRRRLEPALCEGGRPHGRSRVDRSSGKSIGITFFDDEEALKRGDEAPNAMSPSGGGSRTGVEFYEVAVQTMD